MKTFELLEDYKLNILEHCLEINEYKKQNKTIPVEEYERLLDMYLNIIDMYIDSEKHGENFRSEIGDILSVKIK